MQDLTGVPGQCQHNIQCSASTVEYQCSKGMLAMYRGSAQYQCAVLVYSTSVQYQCIVPVCSTSLQLEYRSSAAAVQQRCRSSAPEVQGQCRSSSVQPQ